MADKSKTELIAAAGGQELSRVHDICPVSISLAREVTNPFLETLSDPNNPYSRIAMMRLAKMKPENRLGFANALLQRPGVSLARYNLDGRVPEVDLSGLSSEQAMVLWAADASDLPRLTVPEELVDDVMASSKVFGMMGGREHMFVTEEAGGVPLSEGDIIHIVGAANLANKTRIGTALEILKKHPELAGKIHLVASVNRARQLSSAEKDKVASFAPNATNELELFLDSATSLGFAQVGREKTYKDDSTSRILRSVKGDITLISPTTHGYTAEEPTIGTYKAYNQLNKYGGQILGSSFDGLRGIGIVQVSSSHYMPKGVLNNVEGLYGLNDPTVRLRGFNTIGDIMASRGPDAYLVEFGLFLKQLTELPPALRSQLLEA